MSNKPIAPSCERNQHSILQVLQKIVLDTDQNLLEIGSGTGQHAIFMAPAFSNLHWHTSDLLENRAEISIGVITTTHWQKSTALGLLVPGN